MDRRRQSLRHSHFVDIGVDPIVCEKAGTRCDNCDEQEYALEDVADDGPDRQAQAWPAAPRLLLVHAPWSSAVGWSDGHRVGRLIFFIVAEYEGIKSRHSGNADTTTAFGVALPVRIAGLHSAPHGATLGQTRSWRRWGGGTAALRVNKVGTKKQNGASLSPPRFFTNVLRGSFISLQLSTCTETPTSPRELGEVGDLSMQSFTACPHQPVRASWSLIA